MEQKFEIEKFACKFGKQNNHTFSKTKEETRAKFMNPFMEPVEFYHNPLALYGCKYDCMFNPTLF